MIWGETMKGVKRSDWIAPPRDIYKEQDEIEAALRNVDSLVAEAKENDPEFYGELKDIFSSAQYKEVAK